MERTELMVGEGANRLRAVRVSRHRPDGESRRVPDDRMLWKGTTFMRFAHFPTINCDHSNSAVPRLHSRLVVGIPMEKRPTMTERDVAPEHPNLKDGCDPAQGVHFDLHRPEGRSREVQNGSPSEIQRRCLKVVRDHPQSNELK
jgi:hypothetical protein